MQADLTLLSLRPGGGNRGRPGGPRLDSSALGSSYLRILRSHGGVAAPSLVAFKVLSVTNNERRALKVSCSESKSTLTYTEDASKSHNDVLGKPDSITEEHVNAEEHVVGEQKRAAKIHDFCLGIPYGGIVFGGGLVGFVFSRNPATLINGGLYGGALLALSVLSLKIWRQGHSSLPFILGQAGLAAALLWKNMQTYSLTKKILPTGFYAVASAAMLCFYAYVVVSGGNPPPKKKLKSTAASSA